jgi:hypothetical protein
VDYNATGPGLLGKTAVEGGLTKKDTKDTKGKILLHSWCPRVLCVGRYRRGPAIITWYSPLLSATTSSLIPRKSLPDAGILTDV